MFQKAADRMLFSANHLCRPVQPCCTLLSKLHDSRHNFLPLTAPLPHTLPFLDPDTRDPSCRELDLSSSWMGREKKALK